MHSFHKRCVWPAFSFSDRSNHARAVIHPCCDTDPSRRIARGSRLRRPTKDSVLTSFQDFGLALPIARAVAEEKYIAPTPVQAQTIPIVLSRRDVIGIAQTGTGKTAAFALPILHHVFADRRRIERKCCRVLVLSPTRELSAQILDSFRAYGRHLGITAALAIGGVPVGGQVLSQSTLSALPQVIQFCLSSGKNSAKANLCPR